MSKYAIKTITYADGSKRYFVMKKVLLLGWVRPYFEPFYERRG